MVSIRYEVERFPIAGRFAIARGAKTEAVVVTVTVSDGALTGRGECVPYARYGESIDRVVAAIESVASEIDGAGRDGLQHLLPPGAARNAIDCALWDLEAKRAGRPVHGLAGLAAPAPVTTAYTISLDEPAAMGAAAARAADRPLLKIKLGGANDLACLAAVRSAAPRASLIVDANEGWSPEHLEPMIEACRAAGVCLIEQPLPAADDARLLNVARNVPICADESGHDRSTLAALQGRYDAINIKLDKTGGLTEALALLEEAETRGFKIMIGCMVGTSLAMAPALLLAGRADFVDLDGPLLLAKDRAGGLVYEGSVILPPSPDLWG
jgi:L-alanine-DL-glutamate epimerase-like enolase superfamily enzyme